MNVKKVAIYIRVAQKEQNQRGQGSLQHQKDSCLALVKNKFGENADLEFFVDNGANGLTMKREELATLII